MKLILLLCLALLVTCGCGKKISVDKQMAAATAAVKADDWETAAAAVNTLLKAEPGHKPARMLQALILEHAGQLDQALDIAQHLVKENPDDFSSLYLCGRLSAASDPHRAQEAFTLLQSALALKPGDEATLVLLGNIGTKLKHPRTVEYLQQLRLLSAKYENSPVLHYQLGICYTAAREIIPALDSFRLAIRYGGSTPAMIYNVAARVDGSGFSPTTARKYYELFLRHPGAKNAAQTTAATQRLRELAGRTR